MARKNKRSQMRKPQRGAGAPRAGRPGAVAPVGSAATTPDGPPAQSSATASSVTPPRMVQRPLPRPRGRQETSGALPPEDATIPLERVPYFRGDLARLAITAALMIVVLIVGSFVLRSMLGA